MLMYGNSDNIIQTGNVFNLTSLKEGYVRLNYLIPPNEIGRFTGVDFDIAYANYILGNDLAFKQFFDIIYSLYIGTDVYLIVSEEGDWHENLIESLLKLIVERYGYSACKINTIDDYIFFANNKFNFEFNKFFGIGNLDSDKERYAYIVESIRIKNGGPLIYDE